MEEVTLDSISSLFTERKFDTHKGDYGRVLVVGGNARLGGAVILAAGAALYGGAGLISAATDPCNHAALHARYPEVMVTDWYHTPSMDPLIRNADVLVIGPGFGEQLDLLESLLSKIFPHQKVVLDADALSLIARYQLHIPSCFAVLTPHLGEWKRLSSLGVDDEENHQWATERNLTLLLKGHRSRLYTSRGIYVNTTGNPCMATGGAGDVLSGLLGALLGQMEDPIDACKAAMFLHGYAADELAKTQCPVLPSRITESLPALIHTLQQKK